MSEKIFLYPVWLRIWHFINAIMCLLLILSGISLQYTAPDSPFIRFPVAIGMHNVAGIILSFNYALFFFGNLFTANGKYYRTQLKGFMTKLFAQMRYYAFGYFKGEPVPFPINKERKFNPLQKITYFFIMYICVPVLIVSGWFLLFPTSISSKLLGYSGIFVTDIIHVILGFVVSLFLVVHVYFCTMGAHPSSNFKSIINGYHEPH